MRVADKPAGLRAAVRALQRACDAAGAPVAVVAPDGTVEHASDAAVAWLTTTYGVGRGDVLPRPLLAWFLRDARHDDGGALAIGGNDVRVVARLVEGAKDELDAVILALPEPALTAGRLMALGLTHRQSQALRLAALGLRNRDIGRALSLSQHTVATHLRNVYGKLGVRNRTEAVARAREAIGAGG